MRFGPRFVRLSTLRGCLQPKRSIPSARFSTSSSQGPRVHRQPVLLSIATLTVGSVFVAFASFPGVDAFLLPWAISRSMTKPLSVRHSGRDNQDDADEATETDAAAIRAATSTPGVLILTGDHGTGKTRTAQQAAEGRQAIYINCRGFHSDATAVYSLLHQLVGEGALGIILTSYVKCVNLFLDMWSQNNAHDHTMFILFCQLLDNTRTAITRIGRKQQAQQPPPLIIFDDLEVMLRSKEHSPALKAFLEVFASMSLHLGYDTGLASVVFILEPTSLQPTGATSTYHPDRVATTPLSDTFPELCRRAVLAHFPPRERVPPANADLTHVASAPGVSPSRLWQLYRLAQRPEGVVLGQEQDANWERDARQLQVLEQSGHVVRCLGSDLTTLTSHDQPSRLAGQLIKYRSVQGAGVQPAQVDLRLIACDANNPHLLQPLQVTVPTEEARGTLKRLERELGRRMGGWWGGRVGLYTVCEAGFRPLVSDADVCSLRHGQVVMVGTPDHRARRALPSLLAAGQTQCRERPLR